MTSDAGRAPGRRPRARRYGRYASTRRAGSGFSRRCLSGFGRTASVVRWLAAPGGRCRRIPGPTALPRVRASDPPNGGHSRLGSPFVRGVQSSQLATMRARPAAGTSPHGHGPSRGHSMPQGHAPSPPLPCDAPGRRLLGEHRAESWLPLPIARGALRHPRREKQLFRPCRQARRLRACRLFSHHHCMM